MNEPTDLAVRVSVIEERLRGDATNLALQAKEYERRLTDLNHAHEKQVEDQSTYVSLDKFEGFVAQIVAWQANVNETLAILKGRGLGAQPLRDIVMLVVAAAVGWIASKLAGQP